ncbi:hypothetical protein MED01_002493 [Micromonospora sp. MED01]|uniref:hypothetical protein n=1 Tax=Micromonospora alfalfae TaxID=2911212 RepID=UPI001EE7AA09|nr:hypothetical protein [Micromonospora alfalfae]MCG5464327.1 hypothetical protein [Micromonospora alfalfae]
MTAQQWTVHTSWRAHRSLRADETTSTHPDWPTARRIALRLACLSGARYVTVQDPTGVVVADWDAYTNRWREYALHVGECDGERGPDGEPCDGQLYAKPGDVQVRCPRCGGWSGYRARGMRQPFEPAA